MTTLVNAADKFSDRDKIELLPSILSADFAHLGRDIERARLAGVDKVHVDVMDGHFVPNITIGLPVVEALRAATDLPLDVHLMIQDPDVYAEQFVEAGAHIVTVHAEASTHLHRTLGRIRELGADAGVALNPGTSLSVIEELLPDLDLVLIMTVNPGFGGQSFIRSMLGKIERLQVMIESSGSRARIQVDGGISPETAGLVVAAGARELVAGSAIYSADVPVEEAVPRLRAAAEAGLS